MLPPILLVPSPLAKPFSFSPWALISYDFPETFHVLPSTYPTIYLVIFSSFPTTIPHIIFIVSQTRYDYTWIIYM